MHWHREFAIGLYFIGVMVGIAGGFLLWGNDSVQAMEYKVAPLAVLPEYALQAEDQPAGEAFEKSWSYYMPEKTKCHNNGDGTSRCDVYFSIESKRLYSQDTSECCNSMYPTIKTGDGVLMVDAAGQELRAGMIVVHDGIRHRIISIDGDMVTTKGDNNDYPDEPVHISQIEAIVVGILE
ncbi:MAG: S24/S26 family peptidase [archaeon]